jgi:hypothetical protein
VKQRLTVEEWSELWKRLAAPCGIFWNVAALFRTIARTIHTSSQIQPAQCVEVKARLRPKSCEVSGELTVDGQVLHADLVCVCGPRCDCENRRSDRLSTGIRRPEEQYHDMEENIYIQKTRTVICEATDMNPVNNKL